MAKSLQKQGVPIPDKLTGPQTRGTSGKRFKESGGTPPTTARGQANTPQRNRAAASDSGGNTSSNVSPSLPRLPGANASGGGEGSVGALEVEFLACVLILILLLFANGGDYTTRIMSFIKRGALTCLLFFILALIAGSGPRASKVATAFGALIIVGILVTSPVGKVVEDVDMLVKNDWVGQADLGPNAPTTNAPSNKPGTPVSYTTSALEKLAGAAVGTPAFNAFTAEIRAAKSGQVWKVPVDMVTTLEDLGTHSVGSVWDKLKSVAGWVGHFL